MTLREFSKLVWTKLKVWSDKALRKVVAPGVALLIVAVAIVLFTAGFKGLQIGGLVDRLLGRKKEGTPSAGVVNGVTGGRLDENGQPVPQGTSDTKGHTQIEIVPIKTPGLFSDPTVVEYVPAGKTEPVSLQLPVGVKNTDVKNVVVISPEVVAVEVHDSSTVTKESVTSLLAKYKKG